MTARPFHTIAWTGSAASILDQTLLPLKVKYLAIRDERAMWEAIRKLRVRGAPAIGVAAGYGVYLGVARRKPKTTAAAKKLAENVADYLATSRPTAVNLFWALDRMRARARSLPVEIGADYALAALLDEAKAIHQSDRDTCDAIARHGAPLLAKCAGVLTHCNAGALATAGVGTAVGVILEAAKKNKKLVVYADETRPLLQGARLTAWELLNAGVDARLITDSMAASVLAKGFVQAIVVGADRIAANGDTANKVGTMPLAIVAKHFGVPLYVAAPLSTIDLQCANGAAIPVEERGAGEVVEFAGTRIAPRGIKVFSPAFDVTPASLIAGIVTEKGVIRPPYRSGLRRLFQ